MRSRRAKAGALLSSLIIAFLLAFPVDSQTLAEPPEDFGGDGCTLFPDGNYRECCYRHDVDYFRGGTEKERRESDKKLYRCVRSKKGWQNEVAAPLMLFGVRVFGGSFLPTPFRWGFGQRRSKRSLTSEKTVEPRTD
jgi:hypothetical protein